VFSALKHLVDLGHRDIAFMRGHPASADSEPRWQAICEIAPQLGITVRDELVIQFDVEEFSPELGYPFAKQLLARNKPFTALFAYNDLSAIGAMRAFQESGLKVPHDISVIGFDDIPVAVYYYPSLTTLRQPLLAMGELAARTLVERIEGKEISSKEIAVEGELVIRESTGPVPREPSNRNRSIESNLVKA
jgi:LacI family transcriptional regulator